jgi:hypothetical protein
LVRQLSKYCGEKKAREKQIWEKKNRQVKDGTKVGRGHNIPPHLRKVIIYSKRGLKEKMIWYENEVVNFNGGGDPEV